MRKLLIVLIVLGILGVAADFAAARVFESRVTTILEQRYDLGTRPVIQVRDFPFLPHLITGDFSAIDLAARNVQAEGLSAEALELHLHGVHVPRKVMLGGSGDVGVDRADGEVTLSEAEVNRLAASDLRGGTLSLEPDGVRLRVRVAILGQPVDALVAGQLGVSAGRLTFTPKNVQAAGLPSAALGTVASLFTFEVPMRQLPAGLKLQRVTTERGALVVAGQAASLQLPS
ncbi:MAG TPA: DUF2993 domain-containing protein [Actinomycetota bacterium]